MPVPISVTHPKGAGLVAAMPATLETSGPFARLAAAKTAAEATAAAEAQAAEQQHGAEQRHSSAVQQQQDAGQNGVCGNGSAEEHTIVVDHLGFAYPGLGAWDPSQPLFESCKITMVVPCQAPSVQ